MNRIEMPLQAEFLYGTPSLFPGTLVKEYLPSKIGRWLPAKEDGTITKTTTICWDQTSESSYSAHIPYKVFEWGSPSGNYFEYNFSCLEHFNLPLRLDIQTQVFYFSDQSIFPKTTIYLNGSVDDILLYKLTF